MVSSKATTAAAYLASLPADSRAVIAAVRNVINANLPKGYIENMNWGMLSYEIPLARYPDTYNGQPLMYIALAAQKNNFALYLTGASGNPTLMGKLAAAYKAAGNKLDMGKSCLRFSSLDELPMNVIAEIVGAYSVDQRIATHEATMGAAKGARAAKNAPAKKAPVKKAPSKKIAAKKAPAKKSSAAAKTKRRPR